MPSADTTQPQSCGKWPGQTTELHELAQTRRILPIASTQLITEVVQNNKCLHFYRPVNFVKLHCAAKPDTNKILLSEIARGLNLLLIINDSNMSCCVELFLHVFCNFRTISEALFVKSWVAPELKLY